MVVLEMTGEREGKDFFISRTGADKAGYYRCCAVRRITVESEKGGLDATAS
jgi:hypothetical protein